MGEALGARGEPKFETSAEIASAAVCEDSGLLATKKCTRVITESFIRGTVPTKFCDMHEAPDWALRDTNAVKPGSAEKKPPGVF
jgi:hypothetical protein